MPTQLIGQILGAVLPLLAVAVPLPKREPIAWPVVDPADPNRLILNHRPDRRRWPAAVFAANADLLPYVPYAAAALRGGRGVYFDDPNGHVMEIITHPYGDRREQI